MQTDDQVRANIKAAIDNLRLDEEPDEQEKTRGDCAEAMFMSVVDVLLDIRRELVRLRVVTQKGQM